MFKGPRETLGTNDDRAAHASSCHPGLFTFSDIFPFSEENIDGTYMYIKPFQKRETGTASPDSSCPICLAEFDQDEQVTI